LVISSHKGRGANPPALEQDFIKPDGMDLGSWAVYIPLMERSDAMVRRRDGTESLTTVLVIVDVVIVGVVVSTFLDEEGMERALMTVPSDS
jgi:hypothetical protein